MLLQGIWIHGIREGDSKECTQFLSSTQVEKKECKGDEVSASSSIPISSGLKSAYAVLISDVISGRNSSFVREDELVLSWSIFTPLLHALERSLPPIAYEPGSDGPASALAEDFFSAIQQNKSYKEKRKLQLRSKL
mmetsp:Transcript_28358/g.39567  ORF Transcript_28358/g.39567 Transcript_28358/m.39567 type:complete len:136 (-) Transcript_28358:133-540(-)